MKQPLHNRIKQGEYLQEMGDYKVDILFKQLSVGNMDNFSYIIGDISKGEAAVVDPAWEIDTLLKVAEVNGLKIRYIINTHCHYDHVDGNNDMKEKTGGTIVIHKSEAGYLRNFSPPPADIEAEDGQIIKVGNIEVEVIHTPGHSPGSSCLYFDNRIITGDTLFIGSIGRTDFPGSDPEAMYNSLTEKIKPLPEETEVYPGHNYGVKSVSTIAWEKKNNPYLRCSSLDGFMNFLKTGG